MNRGMSDNLSRIFAEDGKMNAEDRKLKAAKLRAESKAKKASSGGQVGSLIGTGVGALALTNPVTAPFAGAAMAAGGALGGAVGKSVSGGSADLGDAEQGMAAVGQLPTDSKKYKALAELLKSFKG